MSRDVLDLIDAALEDCAVSGDAMRWAPDEPDPTPHGAVALVARLQQVMAVTGAFFNALAEAARPVIKAMAVFTSRLAAVEERKRVRLRRMHSEYHRRTRHRRTR